MQIKVLKWDIFAKLIVMSESYTSLKKKVNAHNTVIIIIICFFLPNELKDLAEGSPSTNWVKKVVLVMVMYRL